MFHSDRISTRRTGTQPVHCTTKEHETVTTASYETDRYEPSGLAGPDEGLLNLDEAIDAEVHKDHDEVDADLDAAEDDADDATEGTPGTKAKTAAKPSRSLFRRVAAKTLEVQNSSATVQALAASLLGSSEDVVELTTSIMAAPRLTGSPLGDIETISEACREDPFEAAITAGALGRARLKGVWSLLHTIGSVGTPTAPPADAKAALAVVKAVNKLTDNQQQDLAAAGELLKRS